MKEEKRIHGVQMNSVIRAWRLLEILKNNTDSHHKLTQNELLGLMKQMDGQCTEKTLRTDIKNLIAVLNPVTDEYTERKEEFRIVYDGIEEGRKRISGVQYIHEFSNNDLKLLIRLVNSSRDISRQQSVLLEEKLKKLGSRYYEYHTDDIQDIPQFSTINRVFLQENIQIIKAAIAQNKKISFIFNSYNREGNLEPVRDVRYLVSPYYITSYGMKYYLLANTGNYENVSIYRLDLMTEVEITCEKRKNIRLVKELEHINAMRYMEKHVNMNYGTPITVTLKVRKDAYTPLHDFCGGKYIFKKSIDDNYDEVEVICSEQAAIDWAIQFQDKIKIIRPIAMQKKIKEKAFALIEKYERP